MAIDTPSNNELYQLLGSSPTSSKFQAFTSSLTKDSPTITKLSNYIYHAYKPLGISFCFIPNKDELTLDAIDVYNGQTRDGFSPFTSIQYLPCGLKSEMQAHEIVSMLGEPDQKGGGGQSRIPCWIKYKFAFAAQEEMEVKDSGILIQLHGFEWEDREMGWTSFVLY